jgi:pilus assembly protein CpaC
MTIADNTSAKARRLALVVATLVAGVWASPASGQKKDPPTAPKPEVKQTFEIGIAVGENKSLPVSDIKQYSDGTPGIVDIKATLEGKLIIVGLKPGTTSVLLIKNNGQELSYVISVFARSPQLVEAEVGQLLEGFPSVRLRRIGGRFFMDGSVTNEGELKRVAQIAGLYPGQVESLVTIGTKDRTTNIRIDFYFVQFNKSSSYQFGINWPATLGGSTVLQSTLTYDATLGWSTATASLVNQPLPSLDMAGHYGWAKVLKQAAVITANGSEATFESGGEQNYPITSGLVASIQKIPYGVTVGLTPYFEPSTRELDIKVNADIADLVPPPSGATILPGRTTTKINTVVHLKIGQSFVLSGIHTQDQRHQIDGLPVLAQIPIIGVLFGTHGDTKTEVEGAIFIVPNVVQAVSKQASDMVGEALAEYEDFNARLHMFDTDDVHPAFPHIVKPAGSPATSGSTPAPSGED